MSQGLRDTFSEESPAARAMSAKGKATYYGQGHLEDAQESRMRGAQEWNFLGRQG